MSHLLFDPRIRAESRLRRLRGLAANDRPRTADGQPNADGGFSLVDILCAIVLMGMVMLPMIEATLSSVRASSTAREIAEIETVLQNAADRVNRAPVRCEYTMYVQAAAQANGWPPARATATYQFYVPGASAVASSPGSWVSGGPTGGCPNGVRTPGLVQLVTITILSDSGRTTRSLKVVKSDV